jgi:tyrosyl-tRNA synthetase
MTTPRNPLSDLRARGLIEQIAAEEELGTLLAAERVSVYAGFDPTSPSLQVGNLVPLLLLRRLQRAGHRPIVVVGGATGMIGDPSGKSDERNLLTLETIRANTEGFRAQLARFVDFDGSCGALLVNNYDWTRDVPVLDFLRDVGKHFPVTAMMSKESVRSRIETREHGISYTEFSYMLLQAFDFLHLARTHECRLQVGGSDQWGNITAGIDLVRRVLRKAVYGLTCPLVLTASGEKLGKTAGNAVWLDPAMTSPFSFYQFWVRTDDADAGRFLSFFTDVPVEEIAAIEALARMHPEQRAAQNRLAEEMTRLVHDDAGLAAARAATEVLYGGTIADLSDRELGEIFADVPSATVPRARLVGGIKLVDLACDVGLFPAKAEAKRRIEGGGVYVNNVRVADREKVLGPGDLASESVLVLRKGKKDYLLVRFE